MNARFACKVIMENLAWPGPGLRGFACRCAAVRSCRAAAVAGRRLGGRARASAATLSRWRARHPQRRRAALASAARAGRLWRRGPAAGRVFARFGGAGWLPRELCFPAPMRGQSGRIHCAIQTQLLSSHQVVVVLWLRVVPALPATTTKQQSVQQIHVSPASVRQGTHMNP